jgi:hypothetical protein
MKCLNDVILEKVMGSSESLYPSPLAQSDHTLSWSVKPQGSSVCVTCACKSKCTWVFRSPATAARWALLFLTAPIDAARGATHKASLTQWCPSNGSVLRLRAVRSGEESETPIVRSGDESETPIHSTNDSGSMEPDDLVDYLPKLPF